MREIKAIIFDLDGVLCDTSDAHREAFLRTLAPLGVSEVPYDRIAGMRTDQALRLLATDINLTLSDSEVTTLTETKRSWAKELIPQSARIFDGSVETIRALSARYSLGLASSSSRDNVERYLATSGTHECFHSILSGDDVTDAKPSPEIFLSSLRNLSALPAEALVIEDSASGIRAAHAAGIAVIAVSSTLSPEELNELGVSSVISSVTDLTEIL